MTHDELRDRLLDLAYGELSPRDAREVEEHAASCEACRAELARIRATRQAMSALPVEPAPARGEAALLAAAREAAERRRTRSVVPRWLWRGALVALPVAAVVAVSIRIVGVTPHEKGEPDALLGSPSVAFAPAPPASPPAPAPSAGKAQGAAAARPPAPPASSGGEGAVADAAPRDLAKAKKESELPRAQAAREAERSRRDELAFATPPAPAPAEEKSAPRPSAPAPRANVMHVPAPAPAAEQRDEARAGYAAGPSAAAAAADRAPARAMAKAAPAAGAAVAVSARQRAIDAAIAHAARMAYDTRKANVTAGDEATNLAELVARSQWLAGARELEGKSFWVVSFSPKDDTTLGGGLIVFVEDGTFRVLRAVVLK